MQREFVVVIDITHCLYCADVPDPIFQDSEMLALLSNEAMEIVRKEHMTSFRKRLLVYDPSLSAKFIQKV